MPAKKKKSKAAAGAARGFATVSTASKAKIIEAEQAKIDEDERAALPEANSTPSATQTSTHEQPAKESGVAGLSPEELEAQLERDELQLIVDKYGEQVRKEASRHATRLKTDRRLLRTQAEDLNVRPWFGQELMEQLLKQVETDKQRLSQQTALNGNSSSSAGATELLQSFSDDHLALLWTLKQTLRHLNFEANDIDEAIRQAATTSLGQSAKSNRSLPIILDDALLTLTRMERPTLANSEDNDVVSQTSDQTEEVLERAGKPTTHVEKVDLTLQEGSGAPGDSVSQKEASDSSVKVTAQNQSRAEIQSSSVHLSNHHGDAVEPSNSTEVLDSSSDESDCASVDADDPRAQDTHLHLMSRLHTRRPDLTEVAFTGKKKGKQSTQGPAQSQNSTKVRKLQSKIAALENDLLFDTDLAKSRWAEKRVDLMRDEAQRRKHGVSQAASQPKKQNGKTSRDSSQPRTDEEDSDFLGLGDFMDALPQEGPGNAGLSVSAEDGGLIAVRDFGKWTGVNPRRLLEEACRTRDSGSKVTFMSIAHQGMSKRQAVRIQFAQSQASLPTCPIAEVSLDCSAKHAKYTMTTISTPDATQSEAYVAVVALFGIFGASNKDEKIFMRLPSVWRDVWNELKDAHQEVTDAADRSELKALRELAEKAIRDIAASDGSDREQLVSGIDSATTGQSDAVPTVGDATKAHSADPQAERDDSQNLMELWRHKSSTPAFAEMQRTRSQLPMWAYKDELMAAIDANQVVIVCGETGCGKSTQTPSFILEHQLSQGKQCRIMCTEPRRISAVSLARRVSQELGEPRNALDKLQSVVGYAIRLDSKVGNMSRLVYATTGVMMRRLEHDSELNDITHLIIDEVHERTIDSDFLLIVLRRILPRRPNLKVILMSATVNSERFSNYFSGAPVIDVPGRTFPVEVKFLEDAIEATRYRHASDNGNRHNSNRAGEDHMSDEMSPNEAAGTADLASYSIATRETLKEYNEYRINYDLILKLLQTLASGREYAQYSKAILVFLPGLAEIRKMGDLLAGHKTFDHDFQIHALHSAIATEDQERAFLIPPRGMRKIVLSTNIAETGVTIPDVTCVIDTGTHKEMRYDERRQLSRLTEVFISRANAKQRRGRAGRVQSGLCFHLFTKARHDTLMAPQQTPEMLRLSLQELVLRVKTCNMGNVEETLAAALDAPTPKNVRRAIEALVDTKALTSGEELTPLGRQLAKLPLDVFLGKLILLGCIFNCLDSTLTMAAILSNKSPFAAPMHARDQADKARLSFKKGDSDLLTVYSAYCTWRQVCKAAGISEHDFIRRNYLNPQTLMAIEETKGQLANALIDMGFLKSDPELKASLARIRNPRARNFVQLPRSYTINDPHETIVNSIIACSFYPKLLVRDGKGWRSVANNQSVALSPTSVNKGTSNGHYMSFYHIMQSASRAYNAHETSMVEDFPIALLCGDADFKLYAGVVCIDSNRIKFALPSWRTLHALKVLRENVRAVVNQRFRAPGKELTGAQQKWLEIWQKMFSDRVEG